LVDIASHYNIEKPSITRRVHLLEEKLLVKAVTGGRDRREKVIQLTEKAENLYAICRERITELEYLAMTGIPEEEQRTVFEVLPKIKNNIQEKEDR
ncbi:MAG TPA: MarR family transcriptional regulator, partial [Mobilitalea sp.]|nr:MarR family transcriptional regulator [Mobilitalea sp.]